MSFSSLYVSWMVRNSLEDNSFSFEFVHKRYQGNCLQVSVVEELLDQGIKSNDFRSLIYWITNELGGLLNLDEQISPESEFTEFVLELSSLLKELCCPYSRLISGPTGQRFQTKDDRSLLINYLISELMAAKMSNKLNPHKKVVIEIVSINNCNIKIIQNKNSTRRNNKIRKANFSNFIFYCIF